MCFSLPLRSIPVITIEIVLTFLIHSENHVRCVICLVFVQSVIF